MKRYATIVADPPWDMGTHGRYGGTVFAGQVKERLAYPSMSTDAIASLPVSSLAEEGAHLRRGSLASLQRHPTTWWNWPRPRKAGDCHSRKPEAFLDLVEQVSPPDYLEMFARDNRLGWDSWGNECLSVELMDSSDRGRA